jgi:hypothetical protein
MLWQIYGEDFIEQLMWESGFVGHHESRAVLRIDKEIQRNMVK